MKWVLFLLSIVSFVSACAAPPLLSGPSLICSAVMFSAAGICDEVSKIVTLMKRKDDGQRLS